jgi:membrane-bound lytic murein transglycosylase D
LFRYLICFALITLTGCAAGKKEIFPDDSSGFTKSVHVKKGATNHSVKKFKKHTATAADIQFPPGTDEVPSGDESGTTDNDELNFDLPVVKNADVQHFVDYYTGPARREFKGWLERSTRFLPLMREIIAEEGLPLDLCYLPMIESGFDTRAVSSARAVGPWQFMERTGQIFGLDNDWWRDERRDPLKATRAAARYLDELYQHFNDWCLAIAAYNAGAGAVRRAIRASGSRDFWKLSHDGYLNKETRAYLPKFFAALLIAKDPEKYGFSNLEYQPPLEYDVVHLPSSTDLDIIARLSGVSLENIRSLNPELKRWCTPPGLGRYPVRLPDGKARTFKRFYAKIDPDHRANFQRYRIKPGDTLFGLARHYGIHARDIVALNKIRNPRSLRVGRNLILPLRPGAAPVVAVASENHVGKLENTYKVRNGDNLWRIARRFHVSTSQLRSWNNMQPGEILHPGQVLQMAGTGGEDHDSAKQVVYKVRPGDTLYDIGRRFNLKAEDIMIWNNLDTSHVLQPGDRLTLMLSEDQRG